MKTKFEVWVVRAGTRKPLEKFYLQGDIGDVLVRATEKLRSMGAHVAEARNQSSPKRLPSLILESPGFPLQVIIIGAQLTDNEGEPLSAEAASTGLSSLRDSIPE